MLNYQEKPLMEVAEKILIIISCTKVCRKCEKVCRKTNRTLQLKSWLRS